MANNINIPQKNTGDFRTAAEDNIITNWGNSPIQPLTTFTDTNIIVDGTASYSTVKAITTATHTITASDVDGNAGTALSAEHEEGNYWTVRYSFSQDCTLTLVGFDTTGNKTGTITPIVSGTYDFYFVAGTFGINLLVKSNTQTSQTQLASPANFQASAGSLQISLSWSSVANATGYTLEFHDGDLIWAGVPAYDGTSTNYIHTSLINGTQYFYRLKATASGYIDSAEVTANATPASGVIQLDAPVLDTLTPGNAQITLDFTNNAGGNEDDNLVQYKLDTEPTVWSNGVVAANAATQAIQTGLTNDLLYDIRILSRGSGAYSNSDPSNELSTTPTNSSSEAQAVLDRMTGLTGTETDAISVFVNNQVTSGNWALMDEFYCFALDTEANSLTGWKTKTATNVNSATHDNNGFTFNGSTNYLNTNFDLTDDGVNFAQNDALYGYFAHTKTTLPAGCYIGTIKTTQSQLFGSTLSVRLNTSTSAFDASTTNLQTVTVARLTSSQVQVYTDGGLSTNHASNTSTAVPLSGAPVFIGAVNNNGSPANYADHTVSSAVIGGGIGFSHSSFNTDLRVLLTALGMTL